jgi:hypothetical protein
MASRVGRGISLPFLTAASEGGEWSAARPKRTLLPGRPGTHCTGGCVGPRAGLDGRKISPHRDFFLSHTYIFQSLWHNTIMSPLEFTSTYYSQSFCTVHLLVFSLLVRLYIISNLYGTIYLVFPVWMAQSSLTVQSM